MACHCRVADPRSRFSLPEVKLGIIPGYGGPQRLPRLVGPAKAAELSINGEPIDGREAVSLGLADEFAPASAALACAFRTAQAMATGKKRVPARDWDAIAARQTSKLRRLLATPEAREILAAGPPASDRIGDPAAARVYAAGFRKGLRSDARLFGEVAASPTGQEWIRRFIEKDPLQSAFMKIVSF